VALVGAVVAGVAAALLWWVAKVSPWAALDAFYQGSLDGTYALTSTIVQAIPVGFMAIGTSLALRGGVFNVGGNGQMAIGALGAFAVVSAIPHLPAAVVWPLAALVGVAGGMLWAVVPAFLEAKRGVNVILTTLLMNYVGISIVSWLCLSAWAYHDPSSIVAQSRPVPSHLWLPIVWSGTTLHGGVFVLLAALVAAGWYVQTPRGLRDEIQGVNQRLAWSAGVRVEWNRALLLIASAGLAGLAGFVQITGADHLLSDSVSGAASVTGGVGYAGLLAAVLAGGRPVLATGIAFLFAALFESGFQLQSVGVALPLIYVLEALVVIGVALPTLVRLPASRSTSGPD
jgi:simple sugar transport system permease protein